MVFLDFDRRLTPDEAWILENAENHASCTFRGDPGHMLDSWVHRWLRR